MRLTLLACCLLFVISSCKNRSNAKFTVEELSWLVYKEGDTIRFQNDQGIKSELLVVYRTDLSRINKFYPIEAEIEIFNPDAHEHFRVYMLKDAESFKRYLRVADVYRPFEFIKPFDTISIANKVYNDVYVFEEDTAEIQEGVFKVFFSRTDGIIMYIMKNQETYTLVNEPDSLKSPS